MVGGYVGKILRVNLTKRKVSIQKVTKEWIVNYIGGEGFAARILYTEVPKGIDPLSPDNKLIIMTGPLTGTLAPSSGRYLVAFKSPLTGIWGVGHIGGHWGPELKFAGFDGIVIEGRAEKPVYLWIHDGNVEFRDASHIWGKLVPETEDIIREETDPEAKVLSIGPAGEKLVKISAIISEYSRAGGRGGAGAVMGSKNLKAIAVRGTGDIEVADPDKFYDVVKEIHEKIKNNPVTGQSLPKYGTAVLVNVINQHGVFPTRNFQTGVFPTADKISGEALAEKYLVMRRACAFCPIGCGRFTVVPSGPYAVVTEGPEYETIWALGATCGVDNLEAIAKANYLCNIYGLETISTGAIIATAMEAFEKGYITTKDTDGIELRFGNADAMVKMVEKIAKREGIGDILAEGSKVFAEKIGHPEISMSVKGLELPAYDPRGVKGHGLAYATSNRGGCHLRAYMVSPEILGIPKKLDRLKENDEKIEMVKYLQDLFAAINSLVVCIFTVFALEPKDYAAMLSTATGIEFTDKKFLEVGERIYNLQRLFLVREGITSKDDRLPARLEKEPMPEGPVKGHVVPIEKMLPKYYKIRGWDEEGRPTRKKLEELGLIEFLE